MLIDLGDFDTLLVMHACLIEPIAFGCACIICLHTMKCSLVLSYDEHDAYTCLVNPLLNAWFCTNANHICVSKCLLSLLLLKELQDGATLESAHLEHQDDEYLVIVYF